MTDLRERGRGRVSRPGSGADPAGHPPRAADRPRIDPRIARRWVETRRQEGRRRLRVLTVVASVLGVAAGLGGSLYTPLFEVRHVRVAETYAAGSAGVAAAGSAGVAAAGGRPSSLAPGGAGDPADPSRSDIASLAGLAQHRLMIDVEPAAVEARLDSDPWLGAATVARSWPSTVTVAVTVRSALAEVALGPAAHPRAYAEIDRTGRVLADVATPTPGLVALVLAGPVGAPGTWLTATAGAKVSPAAPAAGLADVDAASDAGNVPVGAGAALAFLDLLPPSVRADVRSITATPVLSLTVAVGAAPGGTVSVLLGDGSQLQAKATALVTMVTEADLSRIGWINLTVPSRPAAASSAPGPTTGSASSAPGPTTGSASEPTAGSGGTG